MKKIKYLIEFIIIIFLFLIVKLFGLKVSQYIFGFIFKNIGPLFRSKKISHYNLSLALPNLDKSKRNQIINNMWANYGKIFSEYMFINEFRQNLRFSKKIIIENKSWLIKDALISDSKGKNKNIKNYYLLTNLNYSDVNSLFSNLSSLNIFELNDLRKKYENINYSSTEVNSAIQKLISFPFYLTIMTILASTIMLNIKHNKSKIFHLIFGILISVIIYYLSFFFEELGKNEQIPIGISIWIPLIIIMLISTISLIRINEK